MSAALTPIARYRAAVATVQQRAALPRVIDAPLLECLDAGRAFCFLRTLDNVDRVALRQTWEQHRRDTWAADAIARYRDIRHMALGQSVDTVA
jgi:hypothetical protein